LIESIEKARQTATLSDVLVALGIPSVGKDTAALIARHVLTFSRLQLMTADVRALW